MKEAVAHKDCFANLQSPIDADSAAIVKYEHIGGVRGEIAEILVTKDYNNNLYSIKLKTFSFEKYYNTPIATSLLNHFNK